MVTQIITLVGVLIGALASFVATTVAERAKFRREMATRWDERKLDAYIQYTSCVKEILRAARVVFAAREAGEDRSPGLAAMESAESKRSLLFEGLVLLADEDAAKIANRINERTWAVLRQARDPEGTDGTPEEARLAVIHALNDFHKAAKADLLMGNAYRTGPPMRRR
ncbi:hypothetical protein [Streptomyces tagetis]|uniref:Secreted protein n=1 Tax=Streptomyces tagetis TaxID=2820809 RepID=A0A940XU02_9ACTN|nr:hypothetical protein [Streptomyces sp. RG38]MBQ0830849.1 hypothetical protein [Streptomyces sp. RG38]